MKRTFAKVNRCVALLAAASPATLAQAQMPVSPSLVWTTVMPSGPVYGLKVTDAYARSDAPKDNEAIQAVIDLYPLAEFDGNVQSRDWRKLPQFAAQAAGSAETRLVFLEQFFDELPLVLKDTPPLPGAALHNNSKLRLDLICLEHETYNK